MLTSTGERLRSKSREERKDSRNSDLRKEHDEMKSRNQVGKEFDDLKTLSQLFLDIQGLQKRKFIIPLIATGATLRSREDHQSTARP